MADGNVIKGNGALPEIWILNEGEEAHHDGSGYGRGGYEPEPYYRSGGAPSDGGWGHKPYYHRSGSSGRLSQQDLKFFEMLEDMNVESVTFDPSLKKFRESGEDKEGSLEGRAFAPRREVKLGRFL